MIQSKIKEYIGIACQTLMDDSTAALEVLVPELTPMLTGTRSIDDKAEPRDISVENIATSGESAVTIVPSDTLTCHYLGELTNRSRPNIHIGEQVKVVNIADTSKFFWVPLGRDDHLRTTEHLKFVVSNKYNNLDELTDDTSYFIEMDTREGKRNIRIRTSKGTDENVSYDLHINTDDSTVRLTDSVGNGWILDSNEHYIKLWNKDGSYHEIDKENITHHAVNTYKVDCQHYVLNAEQDIVTNTKVTQHNSSDSVETNTNTNTLNAGESDTTNTTTQTVVATLVDIQSPVTQFAGGVSVGAFIAVSGAVVPGAPSGPSVMSGDFEIEGDIDQTGDLSVAGTIHGTSVKSDTNFDGPGQTWPDN